MGDIDGLAAQFEASRPRLRAVAYRMLGSVSEADAAVQEAWLHLSRVAPRGRLTLVLRFTVANGKVTHIDVVADPERLGRLSLAVLDEEA
jgi:RNA polymerase sigma-70 factor (ECF subfamily)